MVRAPGDLEGIAGAIGGAHRVLLRVHVVLISVKGIGLRELKGSISFHAKYEAARCRKDAD